MGHLQQGMQARRRSCRRVYRRIMSTERRGTNPEYPDRDREGVSVMLQITDSAASAFRDILDREEVRGQAIRLVPETAPTARAGSRSRRSTDPRRPMPRRWPRAFGSLSRRSSHPRSTMPCSTRNPPSRGPSSSSDHSRPERPRAGCSAPRPRSVKGTLDPAGMLVRSAGSSMDRASDYGSEGWGFDSLPARRATPRFHAMTPGTS